MIFPSIIASSYQLLHSHLGKFWKKLSFYKNLGQFACFRHEMTAGLRVENRSKNLQPDNLPYDLNRVRSSENPHKYYNASYIHLGDFSAIVGQKPSSHMIDDFWEMVFFNRINVLVDLGTDGILSIPMPFTNHRFNIQCLDIIQTSQYHKYIIALDYLRYSRNLTIYRPVNLANYIDIASVCLYEKLANDKLFIYCDDGINNSAYFYLLFYLLQNPIKMDIYQYDNYTTMDKIYDIMEDLRDQRLGFLSEYDLFFRLAQYVFQMN